MLTRIYYNIKNILLNRTAKNVIFVIFALIMSYGAFSSMPTNTVHAASDSSFFNLSGGPGGLRVNGCAKTGIGSLSLDSSTGSFGYSSKNNCNGAIGYAIIVMNIINSMVVPFIFAISFTVFIWGIFKYFIAGSANPEDQSKGWHLLMYGLIGLAIMMSVWGLVNIILMTFNLNTAAPAYPRI